MKLRFLHTADWHLGQLFHQHERTYEHEQFLTWLLTQVEQEQPHALLIAGDVFDVANPSIAAQKQLYQFLAEANRIAPNMQIIMIAGNHDSASRIEQVNPLLEKYNAIAVGVLDWQRQNNQDDELNVKRLILPIYDGEQIIAWCIALPYLRAAEITGHQQTSSDVKDATDKLYQLLLDEVQQRKQKHQAVIVMSHAHMQGGDETTDSERPILIGNLEGISNQIFKSGIDYVALGHLHKPQKVGYDFIRYSGSPIPLSFSEVKYKHQVLRVEIDLDTMQAQYQPLIIPRSVDLIRITGTIDKVLEQLAQLEQGEIERIDQRPYVDIEYELTEAPIADLRQKFEKALPENRYRLVRVARKLRKRTDGTYAQQDSKIDLQPPTPEELFLSLWEREGYKEKPKTEVRQDFLELEQIAEQRIKDAPKS
ncbi:MAG: exonuclease SbcCD subunit D C-terminal domain-containing protein [Acinetobacter sp.]|nr:exonuclease SbcCD subunit D C-terminal domain-containing protein [Acinetobacter sp.]